MLCPEFQPLTLLHTIFDGNGTSFVYFLLTKNNNNNNNGTPFKYFA